MKIEITSPLRVFSWGFRERWVSRCMRHTTAKFGSLVHRFGMIPVGVLFRYYFEKIRWTPKPGVFLRGAPSHLQKSEATVIESTPIFPRTERVLAESSATLRESCSTEMKRIRLFCPRPTLNPRVDNLPNYFERGPATRRAYVGKAPPLPSGYWQVAAEGGGNLPNYLKQLPSPGREV